MYPDHFLCISHYIKSQDHLTLYDFNNIRLDSLLGIGYWTLPLLALIQIDFCRGRLNMRTAINNELPKVDVIKNSDYE